MANRTFKIGGNDYPVKRPRGMHGVRAVNYIMARFQAAGKDVEVTEMIARILDSEDFWGVHLHHLLGVPKETLQEIEYSEVLAAMLIVIASVMEDFKLPELDAALKNSESTPEEQATE